MSEKRDSPKLSLLAACDRGEVETVKRLLRQGVDANVRDKDESALFRAAKFGHVDVVKVLLKHGANVNETYGGPGGWSALMIASKQGHTRVVSLLMKKGAYVNLTRFNGQTALMIASQNGHAKIAEKLIKHGACVNMKAVDGKIPLIFASKEGHTEVTRVLLQYGANPNMKDCERKSSLTYASYNGYIETIILLLDHKADVQGFDGSLALLYSYQNGHDSVAALLHTYGINLDCQDTDGQTILMLAIQSKDTNTVKQLLRLGANVDIQDKHGQTALIIATEKGDIETVGYLINSSANLSTKKECGCTAAMIAYEKGYSGITTLITSHLDLYYYEAQSTLRLMTAIKKGHTKTVTQLLELGVNVNIPDEHGWTALMTAAAKNNAEIVKLLIKFGVDMNVQNKFAHGCTALIIASERGYYDIVASFIESTPLAKDHRHTETAESHQIDVNIQDSYGWTALLHACRSGHKEIATLLIKHGADLDCQCSTDGRTILMWAVQLQTRDTETVKLLLELGANVDIQDTDGQTALMLAIKCHTAETILLLIKFGANINAHDRHGCTAFMIACEVGYHDIVTLLIESTSTLPSNSETTKNHGVGLNIQRHTDGWTALMIAVQKRHTDIVSRLLQLGAHLNIQNKSGQTALIIAIDNRDAEIVELLIKFGANMNIQNTLAQGYTALMTASRMGYYDIVTLLVESKSLASDNRHPEKAESHQVDMNIQDSDGRTALMMAAECGNNEVAALLMKHGANVNIQDSDEHTALMMAAECGDNEVAALLIEHGANVNIQNSDGGTALMIAAGYGNSEVVTLLIKHGASINIQENDGYTALMFATGCGDNEVAALLIEHGANINIQDSDGCTALMIAAKCEDNQIATLLTKYGADLDCQNYTETVKLLLELGANVNIQDDNGQTALIIAAENRNAEIVELLIKFGANINTQNKHGYTALMVASERGYFDIVFLLFLDRTDTDIQGVNGYTALMLACQYGYTELANHLIVRGADMNLTKNDGWTALTLARLNHHTDTVDLLTKYGAKDADPEKMCLFTYTSTYTATGTEDSGYGPSAEQCTFLHENVSSVHSTVISMTTSEQFFYWKGYGLHLYIPEGALPPEVKSACTISIEASVVGNYVFPDNSHPVSAVYWFHCDPKCKFSKPVILELQHCAKQQNLQALSFVKAKSIEGQSEAKFSRALGCGGTNHGVFPSHSSYGFIQLDQFCGYGVVQEGSEDRQYRANLYYLPQGINQFQIDFTVLWNTDAHHSVIENYYRQKKAEIGPDKPVEFVSESIHLDIPKEGIATKDKMWEIIPLVHPPQVTKAEVDKFEEGKRIPACQLLAITQKSQCHKVTHLIHPLKLLGTRTLHDYITVFRSPSMNRIGISLQEHQYTSLLPTANANIPHYEGTSLQEYRYTSLPPTANAGTSLQEHQYAALLPTTNAGGIATPVEEVATIMPPPVPPQTYKTKSGGIATPVEEVTIKPPPVPPRTCKTKFPTCHVLPLSQPPSQKVLQPKPLQTRPLQESITATFHQSLSTPQPRAHPEPPRLAILLNELTNRVAAKWEAIGISLQLDSGLLEIIKEDNPNDCRARLRETLKEWMKQVNPPPSWLAIIKAVKDAGYSPLARILREKYLPNTSSITLS